MSDLKLHTKRMAPVIGSADVDGTPRFDITSAGREALDESGDFPRPMGATPVSECAACLADPDLCPEHGPDSLAALDAAIAGNGAVFDTLNRELVKRSAELSDKSALVRELQEQVNGYRRMAEGCQTERDTVIAAHAQLIEEKLQLEVRLARLTEHGVPAPATLDEAIEQLFDAEAVLVAAEREVLIARRMKFDAQLERDRDEQAALERVMAALTIKKTEAKDRLEEDERYRGLSDRYRAASRDCDEAESELRIATSRVETLRTCTHAMSHRSPLTARASAIAISRTQQ